MRLFPSRLTTLCVASLWLAGCEQLGLETPAQATAAREAEGRAIGGACRHSGRALEDCYTLNPKAVKAAVFTGWRDMDAYMRENSIEVVPAVVPRPEPPKKKTAKDSAGKAKEAGSEAAPAKKDGHSQVEPPLPSPSQGGKMV